MVRVCGCADMVRIVAGLVYCSTGFFLRAIAAFSRLLRRGRAVTLGLCYCLFTAHEFRFVNWPLYGA